MLLVAKNYIFHSLIFLFQKMSDQVQPIFLLLTLITKENYKILQLIILQIDHKDFVKIYRECTKEPFSFLRIDTTSPASNPLGFRKSLFLSYKNGSN